MPWVERLIGFNKSRPMHPGDMYLAQLTPELLPFILSLPE